MKKRGFMTWAVGLIMVIVIGCDDMDNYSVSPNHQLSFSTDTLSFDTVFTTVGSATGYFMIYNKNDEALKIDKILLAGGAQSGFRINVDGRRGDSFSDIPIWKKDSLYVAVEVTVNPNDENSPFVIYDSVVFVTNGKSQAVLLEAYGQNANILRGGTLFTSDTTLTAERPYLVYDSVMIHEEVTVNIEEGASFYMHKNAKWLIDGTIKANGTQEKNIVFRGDRLNRFSTTISYDNISSQWNGLFFGASSFDNELNYAMIRNGISGLTFNESTPDRKKADIRSSRITNMNSNVLWAVNCHIEVENTEFSNAGKHLVMLAGGKYQFTHCTMANYMPSAMISGSSARFNECLTLKDSINYNGETLMFPLLQAYFDNCIIDGSILYFDTIQNYKGEILFDTDDMYVDGDDERFNYRFNHCIIKTGKVNNERFNEVLFLDNPRVESIIYVKGDGKTKDDDGEKYDYIYDFHLAEKSVGIGKADRAISEQYPTDLYGINRLTNESGPSIGAYEHVPQKEEENE